MGADRDKSDVYLACIGWTWFWMIVSVAASFCICVHIQPSVEGEVFICDCVVLVSFDVAKTFLERVERLDYLIYNIPIWIEGRVGI